jgi:outer membrane protein assembly factor BamB
MNRLKKHFGAGFADSSEAFEARSSGHGATEPAKPAGIQRNRSFIGSHRLDRLPKEIPIRKLCLATGLTIPLALLMAIIGPRDVHAEDWPGWGGKDPGRNMYSPARGLPDTVDRGVPKPDGTVDLVNARNIKWTAALGSQAYGNVVVSKGKVFIGTNNAHPRDPQHQGDRSILLCLDEETGRFLWQLVIPKLASGKVNDWENLGLLSSPSVESNRLYVVSSRCEVVCLDTEGLSNGNDGPFTDEAQYVAGPGKTPAKIGPQDADIIWRYDMMDELGIFPHNASNCSILSIGDILYVGTSNGQDWTHVNVPSPNAPSLIALDKRSGKLLGEDTALIGTRLFHGQWSSPSAAKVGNRWQVFFGGGDGVCYAFDALPVKEGDDGFLKTVWSFDCNPAERKFKAGKPIKYPKPEGPSEINATPVFWKNRVYVAVGQDPEHGEGIGILTCIDATQTGDVTKSAKIWSYDKINRSISTVSITPDGLLFVNDFSGYTYCFDAETGQLHWTHDHQSHIWGSTLVADGKVYCGNEDGHLVILSAAKEKKILCTADLGAPIYSTPVTANGVLYVASNRQLFAFYDAASTSKTVTTTVYP